MTDLHLTQRELDIMSVLWQLGEATVTEVRDRIDKSLAYTSISSMIRTLEMKGYVSHRRGEGKTHVYFPAIDPETAGESALSRMLDKIYGDINPLMRHASAIADNVDYISTSLRVDIQKVSQTVAAVNQRLQQAASAAEDRINQLNALLEVVQEEAESAFVTTASTIRGVQTGINQAFDEEDWNDGDYDEDRADGGEKPRPRVRPRS